MGYYECPDCFLNTYEVQVSASIWAAASVVLAIAVTLITICFKFCYRRKIRVRLEQQAQPQTESGQPSTAPRQAYEVVELIDGQGAGSPSRSAVVEESAYAEPADSLVPGARNQSVRRNDGMGFAPVQDSRPDGEGTDGGDAQSTNAIPPKREEGLNASELCNEEYRGAPASPQKNTADGDNSGALPQMLVNDQLSTMSSATDGEASANHQPASKKRTDCYIDIEFAPESERPQRKQKAAPATSYSMVVLSKPTEQKPEVDDLPKFPLHENFSPPPPEFRSGVDMSIDGNDVVPLTENDANEEIGAGVDAQGSSVSEAESVNVRRVGSKRTASYVNVSIDGNDVLPLTENDANEIEAVVDAQETSFTEAESVNVGRAGSEKRHKRTASYINIEPTFLSKEMQPTTPGSDAGEFQEPPPPIGVEGNLNCSDHPPPEPMANIAQPGDMEISDLAVDIGAEEQQDGGGNALSELDALLVDIQSMATTCTNTTP